MSRKRLLIGGLVLALVVLGAAIYAAQGPIAYARIATHYAAKQTCSCMHVSGRTLELCVADFPPEARTNISVAAEGDVVRASALMFFNAEAQYEDGYGCRILD